MIVGQGSACGTHVRKSGAWALDCPGPHDASHIPFSFATGSDFDCRAPRAAAKPDLLKFLKLCLQTLLSSAGRLEVAMPG